jgi:1-acyl-sn-glycerol-3-phosphate acyltransferase
MTTFIRSVIASFIRLFTGVHTMHGAELPRLPFIVIANHSSHLDTMVIWAALPPLIRDRIRPAGAADYWLTTRVRTWFFLTILNGIAIERQNVSRSNNPIDVLANVLKNGDGVLIFPEGTRSRDGMLQPFKSGVFHLARSLEDAVPIVPIGLVNLQRIMPKGEVVPIPLLCTLRLGPVITIASDESKTDFLHRCQSTIQNMISKDENVSQ